MIIAYNVMVQLLETVSDLPWTPLVAATIPSLVAIYSAHRSLKQSDALKLIDAIKCVYEEIDNILKLPDDQIHRGHWSNIYHMVNHVDRLKLKVDEELFKSIHDTYVIRLYPKIFHRQSNAYIHEDVSTVRPAVEFAWDFHDDDYTCYEQRLKISERMLHTIYEHFKYPIIMLDGNVSNQSIEHMIKNRGFWYIDDNGVDHFDIGLSAVINRRNTYLNYVANNDKTNQSY